MAKDWEQRLDETLQTIETAKITKHVDRRDDVALACRAWVDNQKKKFPKLAEAISGFLSLRNADISGPKKSIRDLRRALMLLKLWQASLSKDGTCTEKDMGDAPTLADNKLLDSIGTLIGEGFMELNAGTVPVLTALLDDLKKDPLAFLQELPLMVSGNPAIAPPGKKLNYVFHYVADKKLYRFDAISSTPATSVQKSAWIIPVTNFSAVKDSFDALPDSSVDASLALTTQFTGCCYCFQVSKDRKAFTAAHVDPEKGKGETGQTISQKLRDGGGFATGNNGKFHAFGRVADPKKAFGYGDGRITIVAVKGGDGWAVYCQTLDGGNNIVDARRIFDPKDTNA